MSKGKVKYFNERRGWGIIGTESSDEDVYVHYSAIQMDGYKTLKEGQEVFYDIARDHSGPSARNVTLAG